MRRLLALAVVALAGVVAAAVAARPATTSAGDAGSSPTPPATAAAERRTLTVELDLEGQLGYEGSMSVVNWRPGVVTRVPEAGTVVERGEALYELDGRRTAVLLYGSRPAWRTLEAGVGAGSDVRQLEENLAALGHLPEEEKPDRRWDDVTTEAVRAFQEEAGLRVDGSLEHGEIVFLPGPVRVGDVTLRLGEQAAPGAPALAVTSTGRIVSLDVSVSDAEHLGAGDPVEVELPDGTALTGSVASISAAVSAGDDSGDVPGDTAEPTVAVTVALDHPPAEPAVAPVTVSVATERREDALAVPVSALVALVEGGYAVEIVEDDGARRLVGVSVGLFADGWVEVESGDLTAGDRVVVPR